MQIFWGQRGKNRKVHWVKWQDLCKPKAQGGMVLKISPFLTMHFWQNTHGGCYMTQVPYSTVFLKSNSFQFFDDEGQNSYKCFSRMEEYNVGKRCN